MLIDSLKSHMSISQTTLLDKKKNYPAKYSLNMPLP